MKFVSKTIALIGVILVVCCSVVAAQNRVSIEELRKSFTKLGKFLESKMKHVDDPEASLVVIDKHLSRCLPTKRNMLPAIGLLHSIAHVNHCSPAVFEDVERIQKATRALSVENVSDIDRLMRTFIERVAKKCDPYHERALAEAIAKMPSTKDEAQQETIFDDQFLESYLGDRRHYWLTFDESTKDIGWSLEKLASALMEVAKSDPNNGLTLAAVPRDETRRAAKQEEVHYLVKKYILDGCQKYFDHIRPVLSYGQLIVNYYAGGEKRFLDMRSKNYKNWLIRVKFCDSLTSKASMIEDLIAFFFQGRQ